MKHWQSETPIKSNINCKKYTKNFKLYDKAEIFLKRNPKKKKKPRTLMQEVCGGRAPSILFFAKPAIQNPSIQPGVFLATMKGQQLISFSIYCHLIKF